MILLNHEHLIRFMKLSLLTLLFTSAIGSPTFAQAPYQRQVRKFEMPELGISDPAGLLTSLIKMVN